MLKTSVEKLLEIVFNPLVEKGAFKEEYVKQEKENVKRIIEGKPDNKARYAFDRCGLYMIYLLCLILVL